MTRHEIEHSVRTINQKKPNGRGEVREQVQDIESLFVLSEQFRGVDVRGEGRNRSGNHESRFVEHEIVREHLRDRTRDIGLNQSDQSIVPPVRVRCP